MRMPERIDALYLAPCGINCFVCYKHLRAKKPCPGCLMGDTGKQGHCLDCEIKRCALAQGHTHCIACERYPCARIKRMDKSYRTRYGLSLVENARTARENGIDAWMEAERARWQCPDCAGAISQHEKTCSECGQKPAP